MRKAHFRNQALLLLSLLTTLWISCSKEDTIKTETPKYTVTFQTFGGTSIPPQILVAGSLVTKPQDPLL